MEIGEEDFGMNCMNCCSTHMRVLRDLEIHEAENLARAEEREMELLAKPSLVEQIWATVVKAKHYLQKTR